MKSMQRRKRVARRRRDRGGLSVLLVIAGTVIGGLVLFTVASPSRPGAEYEAAPEAVVGPAQAAGVEVDVSSVDLGRIPLDRVVSHRFALSNVGQATASLGVAQVEVLEGC